MKLKILTIYLLQLLVVPSIIAQILTNSNLPIIVINTNNTAIPDEPKINATMGIIYNGDGNSNNINDAFNHYNGRIGIETRGNSTQDFDKKTYSIELRTSTNEDTSIALLNMPKEEDWILHAMVIDKTQLRIPMSFYLFREMGHYAANWQFVEVMLNNEYRGLYILTERIKRDKNRVDISKLTADEIDGDDVTGGYILRIDWLDDLGEDDFFISNYNSQGDSEMHYQWYYPKASNIQQAQKDYIKGFMDDFENAVFADDFKNSQGKRYTEYINIASFIDFLLINELSKNSDGYKLSSYLFKDKDSKGGLLNAGPIWDFDQTYGVSLVCSNYDYRGWTFLQNQADCEDLESMPMWWQAMVSDTVFSDLLIQRWQELRSDLLQEENLMNWMDNQRVVINDAINRNFTKWDDFIGEYIWIEPEPIPQTYDEEITYMKQWIVNRLNWMDLSISRINTTIGDDLRPIQIFPNPTRNYVSIKDNQGDIIQIYSTNGQLLLEQNVTESIYTIPLSRFQSGLYFINIVSETHIYEPAKLVIF